ncbi:MAG: hypothetical protein IJD70_02010 [Clostridia bacterium]|nr:hypothetical protein [Clostridia bacterium]
MKRFISLALLLAMLVCFVGCDGGSETKNYVFKSGDVEIKVGGDANAAVSALGEAQNLVETPSCGGGAEPDREYTYAGFKFNTVNENGVNKIVKIVLTDDSVSTPEGISIGDGREAVIETYGEDYTENASGTLVYTDGVSQLMFGIMDGSVSAIHYVEE